MQSQSSESKPHKSHLSKVPTLLVAGNTSQEARLWRHGQNACRSKPCSYLTCSLSQWSRQRWKHSQQQHHSLYNKSWHGWPESMLTAWDSQRVTVSTCTIKPYSSTSSLLFFFSSWRYRETYSPGDEKQAAPGPSRLEYNSWMCLVPCGPSKELCWAPFQLGAPTTVTLVSPPTNCQAFFFHQTESNSSLKQYNFFKKKTKLKSLLLKGGGASPSDVPHRHSPRKGHPLVFPLSEKSRPFKWWVTADSALYHSQFQFFQG